MIQPEMPDMNDPAELLKKIWGAMPSSLADIPGFVMPTMSIEDIDKQIADLTAVEGWLEMNRTMLRSTIQALQVQKSTIAGLSAMSEAHRNAEKSSGNKTSHATTDTQPPSNPFAANSAAWWDALQAQFKQTVDAATVQPSSAPFVKEKSASRVKKTAPTKKTPAKSAVRKAAASKTKK